MRTAHKRYPRKKDVAVAIRTLQSALIMDREPRGEWRTSHSGAPNYRVTCMTRDKTWLIDIYAGSFYCAQVANLSMETFTDLRSLVRYVATALSR